jgi:RND family efflux transporter MFP subunit
MDNKGELLSQLRIDRNKVESPSRAPWIIALILVALVLAGVGVWWWMSSQQRFEVSAVSAIAPSASGSGSTAVLQATGYVTARRQATVSAQITGTLSEVLIEEGEHVETGQVLARLEDTAQQANVAQAQAQVAQARAQVGQIKARLDQAQRDLVRQLDLVGRKLVSKQAVETAQTEVTSLTAQLTAQQRSVDLASAQARSVQVQLDYTTVRAPFAGVIIAKAAQVGEIISPLSAGGGFTRTGVGTIVDMDSLEIEVDVNESYINRVRPGQNVSAILDAYSDWTIPAHVITVVPTADRQKATVRVRIGFDTKDTRILPDMGVKVSFLDDAPASAAPQSVMTVPKAAVRRDGEQDVVFVATGGHAERRAVKVAGADGDTVRLLSGLAGGESVIIAGPQELKDGDRVTVEQESK